MAVHYEVPPGETLVIRGPANVVVKTGDMPVIGEPEIPAPLAEAASRKRKAHAEQEQKEDAT